MLQRVGYALHSIPRLRTSSPSTVMFLVLAALLSPALATTYWRVPPPRYIPNIWRDEGECQLRAWVRAEDLRQNGVSHGVFYSRNTYMNLRSDAIYVQASLE